MDYITAHEIEALGMEAAKALVGADAVVRVQVEVGEDSSDQPAYFFSFMFKKDHVFDLSPGLLHIRLVQQLLDRLVARGDAHYPFIKTLRLSDSDGTMRA